MKTMILENSSTDSDPFNWPGGKGMFDAEATWSGGSVSLEMLLCDGATYVAVSSDTTLAADGYGLFELGPCQLKVNVTTSTAVNARITEY